MAVRLHGFGHQKSSRSSGDSGADQEAQEPEIDDMVILPCYRLPPRGTSCEEWDKPLWVHPFWLVLRTSELDKANMEMKVAEVQVVKTMSAGEVNVGKESFSDFRKLGVPVMTTKKAVKQGEILSIWHVVEKAKKTKDKTVRWDTRIKAQAKKAPRIEDDI